MSKKITVTKQDAVWSFIAAKRTLDAKDLAEALECTTQNAMYWLELFRAMGRLTRVEVGKAFLFAVTARAEKMRVKDSADMRPLVKLACLHEYMAAIHAGDGYFYWECPDCGQTWDMSDIDDIPF